MTATVKTSVSGEILNGAKVDPDATIVETNEDAGDPGLECGTVGEGSDAGGAGSEPDNYDCTRHHWVDLTITKTASPADGSSVATGAVITYTITAANSTSATGTASSVGIRDTLDTGLTLSSVTPGTDVTCSDVIGPEINCTAGSIAPGVSRAVTVVATVAATSGTVLNGARVDPGGTIVEINEDADDPDSGHDCAAVGEGAAGAAEPDNFDCTSHTLGAGLDLTVSKTATPAETAAVATGATITYTLTVSATGGTASTVLIRDKLGTGLTCVSITGGSGVTCADTTGPDYDCTAATVAPGTNRTVTVVATVTATSGTVLNGARVDPAGAITEANEDADDPALVCTDVGEGTDTDPATEPDNFDCTSHTVGEAAGTRTLNLSPAGWHNFVWTGASATAPATALTCISGKFQIAYEWVPSADTFHRFVPGVAELSNMLPLTQYDPLLVLITADNVTCQMTVAS